MEMIMKKLFIVVILVLSSAYAQNYSGVYYDSSSQQYFVNDKPSFSIRSLGGGDFLDKIEYSLNDDSFKTYNGNIKFANEGLHLLRFKAVDPVNNWSPVQSFRIYVDLTKPRSQVSWFGTHYNDGKTNYVSPKSQLVLSASDNLSGISQVLYKNNATAKPVKYSSKRTYPKPGTYSIQYASVDNVGNMEAWSNYSFIVDTDKPQTKAQLKGDVYQTKNKIYTNLGALIELVSDDKSSGVKDIEFKLNNGQSQKYEETFAVEKKVSKLQFRGVDHVGNTEKWQNFTVYLDTDAPKVFVQKSGKHQAVSGKIFAKPGFKLKTSAQDVDSGLKALIVDGVEMNDKGAVKSFDKDGSYAVSFSALDNVGNKANPKSYDVVIDSVPPSSSFASTQPLVERGNVLYSTIPNKIRLTGDDDGVGLKEIQISYDGKKFKKLVGEIDLSTWKQSQRALYYRAVDLLGNIEPVKKKMIAIRDKGPKVGLFVETDELGKVPLSKVKKMKGRIPAGKKK
jgi:hypothetical protein